MDMKRFVKDALGTYAGVYVGTLIYYFIFQREAIDLVGMLTSVLPVTFIVIVISEGYGYWKRKKEEK